MRAAMGAVGAFFLDAFLAQETVGRTRPQQLRLDDGFGLPVSLADIVARSLERNLQVLHFAEIARKRATGLERRLDHYIEKG